MTLAIIEDLKMDRKLAQITLLLALIYFKGISMDGCVYNEVSVEGKITNNANHWYLL